MRSTLQPGKVPKAIATLRAAAIAEADAPARGQYKVSRLTFDKTPAGSPPATHFNQDDNSIARFAGLISPHVGNGRGAPK